MLNKKGQITIFVILAIVIIVGGISYFVFRDTIKAESVPVSVSPVKLAITDCIQEKTELGISLLESSGGYINLPKFYPGSRYQPFSSELTFLGVNIPYWFYMNGANIAKTNVPTVEFMEKEIEDFLNTEIKSCHLEEFTSKGYKITVGEPSANIVINEKDVDVDVDMEVIVSKDDEVGVLTNHKINVKSNLGYLYDSAKSVYDEEQSSFFLENYTIDVLRLYAPVDGVELTCSPKTWKSEDIYKDVKEALQENTLELRNKDAKDDYFNTKLSTDAEIKFLYFKDWTTYFEVNPTNDNVLIAKPVGNEQGMGILGFCYVPYHFVYNFRHPVLIQVSKDDEIFQFPMTVLIEGNLPRKSIGDEVKNIPEERVCENKNSNIELNIYDENLNQIENPQVSFECVGVSCDIDYVDKEGVPTTLPQCVNGVLKIEKEGYKPYKSIYTSVEDGSVAVVLENEYEKDLSLVVGDKDYSGRAIITFSSNDFSKTVIYPQEKNVSLFSGKYDIQIYLYKNSTLKLPETTKEECYTTPKAGLLGLAGMTKKVCSTIEVPEQIITDALIGGGKTEYEFSRGELKNGNKLELSLDRAIVPKTFDELQQNYLLSDVSTVGVKLI